MLHGHRYVRRDRNQAASLAHGKFAIPEKLMDQFHPRFFIGANLRKYSTVGIDSKSEGRKCFKREVAREATFVGVSQAESLDWALNAVNEMICQHRNGQPGETNFGSTVPAPVAFDAGTSGRKLTKRRRSKAATDAGLTFGSRRRFRISR